MTTEVTEILYFLALKLYLLFLEIVTTISDNRKLKINLSNYCKKILYSMVILL